MKRSLLFLLSVFMMITPVQAESYCVMSGEDETVMEEKNMHERQSVASISKIMTAIIAIERGDLTDIWNLDDTILKAHGSSIYLKPGQQISLKTLLYGLLMRSGNDAALAIAQRISGDEKKFVQLMNKKAKAIGMHDTKFHNASGLDDEGEGNISSAFDMALCMSYAMKNKQFKKIVGTKYYTNEMQGRWKNKNRLLFDFPFATGGKTGFTKHAGRTLVTSAQMQAKETIVVTLGVPDDFAFHKQKHQVALDTLEVVPILKKGTYRASNYTFTVTSDIQMVIPHNRRNELQTKAYFKDQQLVIEVTHNKQTKTYLVPAKEQNQSFWKRVIPWI